jgi:hypothetical protein
MVPKHINASVRVLSIQKADSLMENSRMDLSRESWDESRITTMRHIFLEIVS